MISVNFAGHALLLIFGLLFIFHGLVLAGIIPYHIVWAGKIKDRRQLWQMESISLLVLVLVAMIVSLKMGYLNFFQHATTLTAGIWVVFVFFVLNTLGNLTAKNPVEKYFFGSLTLIIALLALRMAWG